MTDPNITVINASLQVQSAAALDYSTVLIVDCNHLTFNRATVYTGPDSYSLTVPTGSALRKALDSAFSVTPQPPQVVVGRSKGTATLTPTSVADGSVHDFDLEVADGETVNVSYTTGTSETAEDIATGWKADIDANTDITDHVTATVVGTGADAVLTISLVSSTDDFIVSNLTDNITITGTSTEAIGDTLTEVSQFNSQWTYITSTDHTPSYQVSAAAAASTREKPYITSTGLEEAYAAWDGTSTPDSNDVGATFAFNQYNFAHCFYHNNADDYPEMARITRFTYLKPGRDNFQYQTLPGFGLAQIVDGTRALNPTELFNLAEKNISTIVTLGGSSVVGGMNGKGNRMSSGVRIETIAVLNYFRQELGRRTDTLLLRKPKLAMNDGDIGMFVNAWEYFLEDNVSGGAGDARALDPVLPYRIDVPKAKDISFEDRAEGLFENTNITCYLDASIDKVVLNIALTFRDPAQEG